MFKNILENYFQKLRIKKKNAENYYQKNNEKEKTLREYYRNFSEDKKKKWKKEHANIRSKNMSDEDKEGKKEYMGNY